MNLGVYCGKKRKSNADKTNMEWHEMRWLHEKSSTHQIGYVIFNEMISAGSKSFNKLVGPEDVGDATTDYLIQ